MLYELITCICGQLYKIRLSIPRKEHVNIIDWGNIHTISIMAADDHVITLPNRLFIGKVQKNSRALLYHAIPVTFLFNKWRVLPGSKDYRALEAVLHEGVPAGYGAGDGGADAGADGEGGLATHRHLHLCNRGGGVMGEDN